jgi:hypothetical protein
MSVERYGYLEQSRSASGIARKPWERVVTGNGGLKGVCVTPRGSSSIDSDHTNFRIAAIAIDLGPRAVRTRDVQLGKLHVD